MGQDLLLKSKDGKVIVDLGRSYHFKNLDGSIPRSYDEIEKVDYEELSTIFSNALHYMVGAKDMATELGIDGNDVLTDSDLLFILRSDFEEAMEYIKDELINVGKKMVLVGLLEDGMEYELN